MTEDDKKDGGPADRDGDSASPPARTPRRRTRRSLRAEDPGAGGSDQDGGSDSRSKSSDDSKGSGREKKADQGKEEGGGGRRRSRSREARESRDSKDSKSASRRPRRGRSGAKNGQREVEELGATTGIDVLEPSSADRGGNGGRGDTGLNLKDLLPFLRPPKTVFVLGASTGGGHNRAANAIFEAMKALDRNLVVRQHDLIDLVEKNPGSADVRARLEDLSRDPRLFGRPFETVEAAAGTEPGDQPDQLDGIFGEALDHVVVDKRPDWIVCTHWLALAHLEALKKADKLKAEVVAVVTDPDLHPRWQSEVVSQWIVPEEGIRGRLVDAGVDSTAIVVAGVPVSISFGDAIDRTAVAKNLGIDRQRTTILFRPGGIGATERVIEVLRALFDELGAVNLLAITGKNERLKQEIEGLDLPDGATARAFGFVDNIHELMAIADVLVTRASTHTVAEAAASGLPMVILRPSPGTEDRMADRLLRRGVAVKAYCEEDLIAILSEMNESKRTLRELKEAAERSRRPDIVHNVVQRIARIVK